MKWTAEQTKALRESIAHWERMRWYRLRGLAPRRQGLIAATKEINFLKKVLEAGK